MSEWDYTDANLVPANPREPVTITTPVQLRWFTPYVGIHHLYQPPVLQLAGLGSDGNLYWEDVPTVHEQEDGSVK